MVKVKYTLNCEESGYQFRYFNTFEDFGIWYYDNYKLVTIWGIIEKE